MILLRTPSERCFFYFEYSLLSEMKRVERICYTFCFPTPSDLMVYMDPCFWNMNVEFLWLYLSRWTVWATSYRRSTGSRTRTTKKLRYRSIYSHVRESQCCNGSVIGIFDYICFLFTALRWWEQWQQQRVCCVSVWLERYTHPALQTSVSLQLLRRHAALPGQQLSHMQAA